MSLRAELESKETSATYADKLADSVDQMLRLLKEYQQFDNPGGVDADENVDADKNEDKNEDENVDEDEDEDEDRKGWGSDLDLNVDVDNDDSYGVTALRISSPASAILSHFRNSLNHLMIGYEQIFRMPLPEIRRIVKTISLLLDTVRQFKSDQGVEISEEYGLNTRLNKIEGYFKVLQRNLKLMKEMMDEYFSENAYINEKKTGAALKCLDDTNDSKQHAQAFLFICNQIICAGNLHIVRVAESHGADTERRIFFANTDEFVNDETHKQLYQFHLSCKRAGILAVIKALKSIPEKVVEKIIIEDQDGILQAVTRTKIALINLETEISKVELESQEEQADQHLQSSVQAWDAFYEVYALKAGVTKIIELGDANDCFLFDAGKSSGQLFDPMPSQDYLANGWVDSVIAGINDHQREIKDESELAEAIDGTISIKLSDLQEYPCTAEKKEWALREIKERLDIISKDRNYTSLSTELAFVNATKLIDERIMANSTASSSSGAPSSDAMDTKPDVTTIKRSSTNEDLRQGNDKRPRIGGPSSSSSSMFSSSSSSSSSSRPASPLDEAPPSTFELLAKSN